MTARFRVELTGQPAILESVLPHLQSPELRVLKDGEMFFLLSSRFEGLNSRQAVFSEAQGMLSGIRAAARIAGLRPGPIEANHVEEQTPTGPQTTTFAMAQAATVVISTYPPTILIDGKPPPLPPPIPVEIALRDDRVARALELFAHDPNWIDLYKVLDVIEEDLGGEKALESMGWATASELKRFTATANSLNAVGSEARHSRDKWVAPKTPMKLEEATQLIGRLLTAWMATK